VGALIGLYLLYIIALFIIAAIVFINVFELTSSNIYVKITVFVIQVAYFFPLMVMVRNKESLLWRLIHKAEPAIRYCWERKWLWLDNVYYLTAVIASYVFTVMSRAVEYWLPTAFDRTLRNLPVGIYTPGERFFIVVWDFLKEMTVITLNVSKELTYELRSLEWR
jgi:hypothetical protein